jgi:hypothetical protein
MLVETAQILCTTASLMGFEAPWAATHSGHPVMRWVKQSRKNWDWLCKNGVAIMVQYGSRYDSSNKSVPPLMWAVHLDPPEHYFDEITDEITPFQLSVYPKYVGNALNAEGCIEVYQKYYRTKERMWWDLARMRCLANVAVGKKPKKEHRPVMVWREPGVRGEFMGPALGDWTPTSDQIELAERWGHDHMTQDFNPRRLTDEQQGVFADMFGSELIKAELVRRVKKDRRRKMDYYKKE